MQAYMVQKPHRGGDCKYIQSALLNLSMGDKQNYLVISDPKNNKENVKIYIHNHVRGDS